MVTTRSGRQTQYQDAFRRMQRSSARTRAFIKRYRPNDSAKRHRLSDRQPKTQTVSGYTRRT